MKLACKKHKISFEGFECPRCLKENINTKYLYVVKGISREALIDMAYRAGERDATEHIRAVWDEKMKSENTNTRNAICGKSVAWAAIQRTLKHLYRKG